MNKKLRYPMEAFALAVILFSQGMKTAMVVGIALVFGDVLQCVLSDISPEKYAHSFGAAAAAATGAIICLMETAIGVTPTLMDFAGFIALGVLLIRHHEERLAEGVEFDYNQILFCDSIAYGIFVLTSMAREYLAGAAIFETELSKVDFVSGGFGKPMFGLIFAALTIALINRILSAESSDGAALWVCIPTILLAVPFVWDNVPEAVGTVVGVVMTGVVYLLLREKLQYTNVRKHIEGVPVEMAALGMIYMVFSLL